MEAVEEREAWERVSAMCRVGPLLYVLMAHTSMAPWILITHAWRTFTLVGFKIILGSFGALFSK